MGGAKAKAKTDHAEIYCRCCLEDAKL